MRNLLLSVLLIISISVTAQVDNCKIRGLVVTNLGDPIPFSTISVPSSNYGVMSNADGRFELECGVSEIKIQCLGYNSEVLKINKNTFSYKVTLSPRIHLLPEVVIDASAKDPAYNMIRKAIIMISYYKKQIVEYEAEIYTRNYIRIDKVTSLFKLVSGVPKDELEKLTAGYFEETFKNYKYW